ncbi:hypothetical protein A6I85_19015 [Prescottella equi]|nr:hypothetical protein [Prescottella equi]ORL10290.1 hypothetical protein A6I85_19015 [Prescottella equi]
MVTELVWSGLANFAASGELALERGVAMKCASRCEELVSQLKAINDRVLALTTIDGFGDLLPSGVALAGKFERKASGGDYSLDRALADHITQVEQMRDVFLAIENRYAAAEEANTAAAAAVESQIN